MVIWYIQYKKAPINFQVTGFHKSQVVSLAFHTTVWFSYSKVFLKVFSTLGGGSDPVKCNRWKCRWRSVGSTLAVLAKTGPLAARDISSCWSSTHFTELIHLGWNGPSRNRFLLPSSIPFIEYSAECISNTLKYILLFSLSWKASYLELKIRWILLQLLIFSAWFGERLQRACFLFHAVAASIISLAIMLFASCHLHSKFTCLMPSVACLSKMAPMAQFKCAPLLII